MSGHRASLSDLLPGLTAAVSFSIADILLKVVFASGMDVLSLASLRGVLVVVFFALWLRLSPPARPHTPRERWIALAIGRAQDVMGTRLEPADAAQVQGPWAALVSVAIIVAGIALWERRERRRAAAGAGAAG